jgi:hypothetical protein
MIYQTFGHWEKKLYFFKLFYNTFDIFIKLFFIILFNKKAYFYYKSIIGILKTYT